MKCEYFENSYFERKVEENGFFAWMDPIQRRKDLWIPFLGEKNPRIDAHLPVCQICRASIIVITHINALSWLVRRHTCPPVLIQHLIKPHPRVRAIIITQEDSRLQISKLPILSRNLNFRFRFEKKSNRNSLFPILKFINQKKKKRFRFSITIPSPQEFS